MNESPSTSSVGWSLFLIAIGFFLLAFLGGDDFRVLAINKNDVGPRALPGILGVVMLGSGIATCCVHWREWFGLGSIVRRTIHVVWQDAGVHRAFGLLCAVAVYLIVMPWLGFVITSSLLSFGVLKTMGMRTLASLIATALLMACIKVVFSTVFAVPLPEGFWS